MIKKISPKQLRVGMYVTDLNLSWFSTPFVMNSFKVNTNEQVKQIYKLKTNSICIDTNKGVDIKALYAEAGRRINKVKKTIIKEHAAVKTVDENIEDNVDFEYEMPVSKTLYTKMRKRVATLIEDVRMNKSLQINEVGSVVVESVDSVCRNKEAMVSMVCLNNMEADLLKHSVNVSVLAITMGRYLGLSKNKLVALGMAGILHDLGKLKVAKEIIGKPGLLNDSEYEVVKNHVKYSIDILKALGLDKNKNIYDFVAHHHERSDGSGYGALPGEKISRFGFIGAIVDVYAAMISNRPHRKALFPFDALRFIYKQADITFEKFYVEKFIKCVGLYPIGTYLELNTKEIAVVTKANSNGLLRPMVRIIISGNGYHCRRRGSVDLSAISSDGSLQRKIKRVINNEEYNLPPSTSLNLI